MFKEGLKSEWQKRQLRGRGLRITRPRKVVFNILCKTKSHLTAQNIYFAARKRYPDVGLASIYRNLELFADIGIVLRHDFGENQARYELAYGPQEPHHHHHLICRKCNKVIDYSENTEEERSFLRKREKGLSGKYGFKIEGHFIDFVGLCKECRHSPEKGADPGFSGIGSKKQKRPK